MFQKRDPPPSGPGVKRLTPKAAVCFTTPAMTRRAADWLGRLGGCRPLAILSDDFDDVVWNCEAERADLLVLEMDFSNGVEDKDVSGRCDIAAEVRKGGRSAGSISSARRGTRKSKPRWIRRWS